MKKIILLAFSFLLLSGCSLKTEEYCVDSSKIKKLDVIKVKDGLTEEDLRYVYYTEDGRAFDLYVADYKIGEEYCFKTDYK